MLLSFGLITWSLLTAFAIYEVRAHRNYPLALNLCLAGAALAAFPAIFTLFHSHSLTDPSSLASTIGVPILVIVLIAVPLFIHFTSTAADRFSNGVLAKWRVSIPGIGGSWTYHIEAIQIGTTLARISIVRVDALAPKSFDDDSVEARHMAKEFDSIDRLYRCGEFKRLSHLKIRQLTTPHDHAEGRRLVGLAPDDAPEPMKVPLQSVIEVLF
jgi:hypothetical protein